MIIKGDVVVEITIIIIAITILVGGRETGSFGLQH